MSSECFVTPVDFTGFSVSAKIDFVTIVTDGQCDLPALDGTPRWSRREHYRRLSIHDATPGDVRLLTHALSNPEILELEVAVDTRPLVVNTQAAHAAELNRAYYALVTSLHPYDGLLMSRELMGVFNPYTRRLEPCDMRPPRQALQAIWGHRSHPAQVKLYVKGIDQGEALAWQEHLVRMEVRLSGDGLAAHGLRTLGDLLGFKYRKQLSPYFRTACGTRRRRLNIAHESDVIRVVRERLENKVDVETWRDIGAPGFRELDGIVMKRHIPANQRIGQALGRLEKRCAEARLESECDTRRSVTPYVSTSYADYGALRMTY